MSFKERAKRAEFERVAPNEDTKKRLRDDAELHNDWFAFCQSCKAKLTGRPSEIKGHVCGTSK